MQTYRTYFKREFDKKRENSGVLARFVLFLAGIAYFFERTIKTVDKKILSDIIKVQFKRSRNIGDGETSSVRIRTSREGVLRLEDTVVTGGRRNRFSLLRRARVGL